MKRYLEHIQSKEPHERRKHALRISGVIVGLIFVGWLMSFGARLGSTEPQQANSGDTSQTASAANATTFDQSQAQLEVSTTSVYSY